MTRLRFWWQRRRAGLPVRFGERPTNVSSYSKLVLLKQTKPRP